MSHRGDRLALLSNATATSTTTYIADPGGRYVWAAVASNWNGATAKLQFLGPDGATWVDVASASLTANGSVSVDVALGSSVRVAISVAVPVGVYSTLCRAPQ